MNKNKKTWPWNTVGYQVYPRSFKDTTGNGIGDIPGIIAKLDYIKGLGAGAVWLSPFYPSPGADFGYDVADYRKVDPLFGTLDDFDRLLEKAHRKGMRVIIDFVPNHTSDRHPWFKESRSSKDNSKRDWYIWKDSAEGGGPPNNWLSVFGGSAWEYDKTTGQYYLHSFLKEQPDLNWENPKVREAMKDNMRFWLSRGVDGVRLDAVHYLSKDVKFRDEPVNPVHDPAHGPYGKFIHKYSKDGPRLFEYLDELVEVLGEFKEDKFMITETSRTLGVEEHKIFYRKLSNKYTSPFNFCLINLEWNAPSIKAYIDKFHKKIPRAALPVYAIANHDNPRVAAELGAGQARVAAMLLLSLPGMPFIYQGQELGMQDVNIPENKVQDPAAVVGKEHGRDPERTPMQWNGKKYAGFSGAEPWLPVGKNYKEINVETELADKHSMLNLYRELTSLRTNKKTLRYGRYKPVNLDNKNIFAFQRILRGEHLLVVLNLTDKKQTVSVQNKKATRGRVLIDTGLKKRGEAIDASSLDMEENEGLILEL